MRKYKLSFLAAIIFLIACNNEKLNLLIFLKEGYMEIINSEKYVISKIEVYNNFGKEVYSLDLKEGQVGKDKIFLKTSDPDYVEYGQWTEQLYNDSLYLTVYAGKINSKVFNSFTVEMGMLASRDSVIVVQDKSSFP